MSPSKNPNFALHIPYYHNPAQNTTAAAAVRTLRLLSVFSPLPGGGLPASSSFQEHHPFVSTYTACSSEMMLCR